MVVNFGHIIFAQVRQLVASLNKKNFKASSGELSQLVDLYGHDVHVYLIRCLISHLDLKNSKATLDQIRLQFLAQEFSSVCTKANHVSILCQAFEGCSLTDDFCNNLAKVLKMNFAQQVSFGLALAQSLDLNVQLQGIKVLKAKIPECSLVNIQTISANILSSFLYFIRIHSAFAKERDTLFKNLGNLVDDKSFDVSLFPLLRHDNREVDSVSVFDSDYEKTTDFSPSGSAQLAEAMEDLGYGCCSSLEIFLELLNDFPGIDESTVAHILAMMAATSTGLSRDVDEGARPQPSSWNEEVLIQGILIMAPDLEWSEIAGNLVKHCLRNVDILGLKLILRVCFKASAEKFPLSLLYGRWRNSKAQLSLIRAILMAFEDVKDLICIDDCPLDSKENLWACIQFVETLLRLSDMGECDEIRSLFSQPISDCPEILLATLGNVRPSWGPLFEELVSSLIGKFFSDSSEKRVDALQTMWGCNKTLLIHGLVLEYTRCASLSTVRRIYDILNEIDSSAVPETLSSKQNPFFSLDLAVLAAQSNAFPLANWIKKAVEDRGDDFAVACITFLRERCYRYTGLESNQQTISSDMGAIILQALQAVKSGIISIEVKKLVKDSQGRLLGGAPPMQNIPVPASQSPSVSSINGPVGSSGGVGASPSADNQDAAAQQAAQQPSQTLFPPEIEEEANSHFQRIYTSELHIDDVIQLLKEFKLSQNPKKQEVFACMIHNLFDEYRFFPRYPERELLITGKLFGSLIQHQLVSSITLGIALRYVLEALRKPLRSSMFKFGMCALEQFKSRLVEWPQYCHHILQIQHIRTNHEELIDFIQRALSGGRPTAPETLHLLPTSAAQQGQVLPTQAPGYLGVAPDSLMPSGSQMPQSLATASPGIHSSSQAQAYGAFGMQQPVGTASGYSGFSQGFGQDPHHQLPSNLQNFASDSSGSLPGIGLGVSQDQAPQALDMRNSAVQQTLSVVSGATAFGAVMNVDMLMQRAKQVTPPDSAIIDKVSFIFNNLSNTNLEQKEKDLAAALNETHLPWLCQYIVIKRAAQESNYHSLYQQFCDRLDKKPSFPNLMKGVIACTIDNIKILLADEKITSSSSVRSLLKNLGSWLGLLTLQKNKPILQKDLDFKQLLIDAYDKGRLIAVVPFVAKVIDSCTNSRIFRPPNPWTMMVLGILAELHPMGNLKLSIKFEVEVLCKNMSKEVKDIKPSSVLKNRPVVKEGNGDWSSNRDSSAEMVKPLPQVPDPRLLEAADRLNARANAGISLSNLESSGLSEGQPVQVGSSLQMPQPTQDSMQNVPNLAQYLIINPSIPIFQQFPQLRTHVLTALTVAIKEIISPVVERSVTIARITTQELILKDYAFESDDTQMKNAAHMMVQNLAGSLALVTCKEPLRHSMCNQLRTMLQNLQIPALDSGALEQAAQQVAFDNLELGCNLIEKAATDKAVRDIDSALDAALLQRRKPGTPLHESFMMMQNWLRFLPESLRPKSGLSSHQKRVYEDFARLPRERIAAQLAAGPPVGTPVEMAGRMFIEGAGAGQAQGGAVDIRLTLEKCCACMAKAEEVILRSQLAASPLVSLPQGHELFQHIMQARQFVLASSQSREEVAVLYSQKVFKRLYDNSKFGTCQLGVDWMLATLQTLNEITKRVSKELTVSMAFSETERKINRELTIALVQSHLLSLNSPEYLKEIMKVMDSGRNAVAVHSMLSVVQHCVVEKRVISRSDCAGLLELLEKVALSKGPNAKSENILKVLDDVLNVSRGAIGDNGEKAKSLDPKSVGKIRDQPDPPHLRNSVFSKMQEWMEMNSVCQSSNPHSLFLHSRSFLSTMLQFGWLKGDEITERFFRLAVEWCVEKFNISAGGDGYGAVDSFSRLVKVLFSSYESWAQNTVLSKIQLLNKILVAVIKVLRSHHLERKTQFNQKPFHRLLLRIIQDDSHGSWALGISDVRMRQSDEDVQPLVLAMADTLYALQPRLVSGFSFAWLELVSHKQIMPALLKAKSKGWISFHRLLMGLFKYLEPYLRSAELHESTKLLYKGTLRVLLVLLHDFPEFLCEYHVTLCDAIPPSCIQLRNLILSAFPRNMQLPDPLCPGLKLDMLADMSKPPAILSNYTSQLIANSSLRVDLDNFLKGRVGGNSFLSELPGHLVLTNIVDITNSGGRYNVPLLNALVLYTATFAISQGHSQHTKLQSSPSSDIFLRLAKDLDSEGRYLFLNAIANQLRYPNSHTHYFSSVLLNIFESSYDKEIIREQVTRVLIERLIVNKPHPWGLLVTFIELIKNPQYDFWRHDFVRSSKEIEQLFLSVAKFCGAAASAVDMGSPVLDPTQT